MAQVIKDRVREVAFTTGTGPFSLSGAPLGGYQPFSAVCANGDTVYYSISDPTGAKWEVGLGTWGTLGILTRSAPGVLSGSNGVGVLVSFDSGTKDVALVVPATIIASLPSLGSVVPSRLVRSDSSGQLASNSAITTGAIPKSVASGASLAASLISDDGTNVTIGGGLVLGSGGLVAAADGGLVIGVNGGRISQETAGTPDQSGLWTGSVGNAWIIAEEADRAFDFAHAAQVDPTLFIHSHNQSTAQWISLSHSGTGGFIRTGVGDINTQSLLNANAGIYVWAQSAIVANIGLYLGDTSGAYASIGTRTESSPAQAGLWTGTLSNAWLIAEHADRQFNFAHPLQADPSLFIHSHNQSTTEWVSLAHDGTQARISTGVGPVTFDDKVLGSQPAISFSPSGLRLYASASPAFAIGNSVNTGYLLVAGSSTLIPSAATFGWTSGSLFGTGADTGLARVSAGVLRVTNGSTGDGIIRVGIGTAAIPSISFTGDTGTGFWNSPTGNMFFTSGGTSRVGFYGSRIQLNAAGGSFEWSSGATDAAGPDTRLMRSSAGVVSFNTGAGTADGTLIVGAGTKPANAIAIGAVNTGFYVRSAASLEAVMAGTAVFGMSGAGVAVNSTLYIGWSSSTVDIGATDTRLAKHSTAVIKGTDGSGNIVGFIGGGAAVASATALPLPTGRVFHVTGTTTVTSITSTGFQAGAIITIIFDGALTFTDGSNLKLAGDFVTTADDTITLCYDGTNWYEVCRSVN
jgi:hypothetical protein